MCGAGTYKIDIRMAEALIYTFQKQYHLFVLLKMPQEKLGGVQVLKVSADDSYHSRKRQVFNYEL